jgi:hypothetical protein
MPATYHYLALNTDHQMVVDWFKSLPHEVTVDERADRILLYFRAMAKQSLPLNGTVDQKKSPLVFIQAPTRRRGTLWTSAEVCFSPQPFRSQFPKLHSVSRAFSEWLGRFDMVFSLVDPQISEWDYYLEGGIRNFSDKVFALPEAMRALRSGQYFVHFRDSDSRMSTLAKTLALRGYNTE